MDTIIIMFGLGMVVHLAVSLILEKVFFKRSEQKTVNTIENISKLSQDNQDNDNTNTDSDENH